MFNLAEKKFSLSRIGLVRASMPTELANLEGHCRRGVAMVVTKNYGKLGRVEATKYVPSAVLVAGAMTRSSLLAAGISRAWMYVEAGALEIKADDAIGCNELMQKLNTALREKIYGNRGPLSGQPWPYVMEV